MTAVVASLATVAIALVPKLHFAYQRAVLQVVLETGTSLIGVFTWILLFGRLQRSRRLMELVLVCALAVLVLSNLFALTELAVTGSAPHKLAVYASLAAGWVAGALFAVAAFAAQRQWRRPGLLTAGIAGLATAALLSGVTATILIWHPLPGLSTARGDFAASREFHENAVLPVLELAEAVLYAVAAAGFLKSCQRLGDEFFAWLACAAALASLLHIQYFFSLYPSPQPQWAHTGEALRLSFFLVLLVGCVREIWSYWRAMSAVAVAEERQRIARDVHDGVAQELAYLARNLDSLHRETGDTRLMPLLQAAERAQFESRRAISYLTALTGQAVEVALARSVGEIADRFQVGLELDLAGNIQLPPERADALVRIACEAVINAAQHSGATRVSVRLRRDGKRVRLQVSDTGRGFDVSVPGGGYGLISMGERARSAGGELQVSAVPGAGSLVEAVL